MALLSDNLTSYWKFDEASGNASDSTANAYTLTNQNSTAYTTGKLNNGISLVAASSKYFSRTNQYNAAAGSVSFWVKLTTNASVKGSENSFVCWDNNSGSQGVYITQAQASNKITYGFGAGGVQLTGTTALVISTWYHIVAVWDATSTILYVNGVADVTGAAVTYANGNTTIYVGTDSSGGQTRFCNGVIDELGIWSRKLTSTEVTSLYNSGNAFGYPWDYTVTVADVAGTPVDSTSVALGIVVSATDISGSPIDTTQTRYNFQNQTKNTGSWTNQTKN